MNGSSKSGYYLVHSTNLKNNGVENLAYKMKHKYSKLKGPAVLLPRVGKPTKSKICILESESTVILSDCVLAIETLTINDAVNLQKTIIRRWASFSQMYQGTGAKYTTVKKLEIFLSKV
ncbi:MAG: hypothetical protein RIF39_12075 [Cyclobacteriaceae bacterium]